MLRLRVLRSDLPIDDGARRRFRKEALALARLDHPNIAVVHEVGEHEGMDRSVDYLETRSDIAKDKLAYLGVSMGSAEGVDYATLLQDKFRAVIFLDGGFFLFDLPPGVDQVDYAPRMKKPELMVNGRYDFSFSIDKSQTPLFAMLGTLAADKRHVVMESPHDVTVHHAELLKEVLGWLDKYVGPVD